MDRTILSVVAAAFAAVVWAQEPETARWQAAIDAANARGGGVVNVPAGRHLVGQLELKSNVELHLEDGCELVGTGVFADYPLKPGTATPSQKDVNGWCALLFAANATNIAVTGRGTVDGRGDLQPARTRFPEKVHDLDGRARNILFASCRGVTVRDVTLRNPAMWNQHYFDCEDVTIENVRVFARVNYNNDGLDIDSCRRVTVRGCDIDSTDDAIVFKTTSPHPCEDVLVENCRLSSQATALKFGTESLGDFRRFRIRNLTVRPSGIQTPFVHPCHITNGIAAVEVSTVDGALIEDVDIDGIDATGSCAAFFVRVGKRCRPLRPGGEGLAPGRLRRVRIANLTARDMGDYGASVSSYEEGRIAGVTLENIRIEAKGGVRACDYVPESKFNDRATGYPSPHGFGHLPAKGLFRRFASDVTVRDFSFSSKLPDVRPERLVSGLPEDVRTGAAGKGAGQ